MLENLKVVSEKLLEERMLRNSLSDGLSVKGMSQLNGECRIHVSSENIEFFINYNEEKCLKLYGNLGNLVIHRNIILEEYSNNSLQFDRYGVRYLELLNRIIPNNKLGVRGIFKIFNFYSSGELILSLYFPYKDDSCGYEIITEGEECMIGVL